MIEASNADKKFIEDVILQTVKDGIIINTKSPNKYDSSCRKLSTDKNNINPSQQPSATNTPFHFLSDTFTPPQDKVNKVNPVDTEHKLNVHKTFRRRPGRFLNVSCTFNLGPVSTGKMEKLKAHCLRLRVM